MFPAGIAEDPGETGPTKPSARTGRRFLAGFVAPGSWALRSLATRPMSGRLHAPPPNELYLMRAPPNPGTECPFSSPRGQGEAERQARRRLSGVPYRPHGSTEAAARSDQRKRLFLLSGDALGVQCRPCLGGPNTARNAPAECRRGSREISQFPRSDPAAAICVDAMRDPGRKANPEMSPSVGMQPLRGFPRSKDGRCPRLPLI